MNNTNAAPLLLIDAALTSQLAALLFAQPDAYDDTTPDHPNDSADPLHPLDAGTPVPAPLTTEQLLSIAESAEFELSCAKEEGWGQHLVKQLRIAADEARERWASSTGFTR